MENNAVDLVVPVLCGVQMTLLRSWGTSIPKRDVLAVGTPAHTFSDMKTGKGSKSHASSGVSVLRSTRHVRTWADVGERRRVYFALNLPVSIRLAATTSRCVHQVRCQTRR